MAAVSSRTVPVAMTSQRRQRSEVRRANGTSADYRSSPFSLTFAIRETEGGSTATVPGPGFAPPAWLTLVRIGVAVTGYYRHAITDPWTPLFREVVPNLPDTLEVGLAVSSHADGCRGDRRTTGVAPVDAG